MVKVIQQTSLKLIIFLVFSSFLTNCKTSTSAHLNNYETKSVLLPSGESFEVYMARTPSQQVTGLSGIKSHDFSESKGMFFTGETNKMRQFWMPETYFDLDIIFLSSDLYILDIHRGLKHFEKTAPKDKVPRSKKVICTHVLEVKSGSKLAQKLEPGIMLKWSKKRLK